MKIKLEIANDHKYAIPDNCKHIIEESLDYLSFRQETIISLAFLNEDEMSKVYHEYYGYTQFTDVLSFNSDTIDPETGVFILGEILICYPFVEIQAKNLNNSLFSEIYLLIIHGILHLLGYDHVEDQMKKEMWKIQTEILTKLNITINNIPE